MGASLRSPAPPDRWKSRLLSELLHGSPAAGGLPLCDGLHVLVVDDNEINRLLAIEILQRLDIVTMQASDGAQAVALACALEFDLILMDLQMPMLDGLQATRQIRAFEGGSNWARVPIVAYTALATAGDLHTLQSGGIDDVLDKPSAVEAMRDCLCRWCPVSRLTKRELARSPGASEAG